MRKLINLLIRTILEIYFSINIYQLDRVLEFVKWISQIDQLSKLNLIINNQYKYDDFDDTQKTKEEYEMLNKEIDYLESSPALDSEIWNSSKYIDLIVSAKSLWNLI